MWVFVFTHPQPANHFTPRVCGTLAKKEEKAFVGGKLPVPPSTPPSLWPLVNMVIFGSFRIPMLKVLPQLSRTHHLVMSPPCCVMADTLGPGGGFIWFPLTTRVGGWSFDTRYKICRGSTLDSALPSPLAYKNTYKIPRPLLCSILLATEQSPS